MGFTLEEINLLLELLTVEQGKQAVKNNESVVEKYETIKQKLHVLTRNFRSWNACFIGWGKEKLLLSGLVEGLIVAWILVQFNVDKICIEVLQPFVNQCELTTNHFYFVLGLIGFISGCIYQIHKWGGNNYCR